MLQLIFLIVIVPIGLIIFMPGTNVAAKPNSYHFNSILELGFGIDAISNLSSIKIIQLNAFMERDESIQPMLDKYNIIIKRTYFC